MNSFCGACGILNCSLKIVYVWALTDNSYIKQSLLCMYTHFNFKEDKTFCIQLILTSEAIKKFLRKTQEDLQEKQLQQ